MAGKQLSLMRFWSKTKASDCTTSGATGWLSQDDSRIDMDDTVSEKETGSESGDQPSHKMTVDMRILVTNCMKLDALRYILVQSEQTFPLLSTDIK